MWFPVFIIWVFGAVLNIAATPTGPWDPNLPPKFTLLLARLMHKRELFCEGCLLWCRNRDLAEEFSDTEIPYSNPPHPEDSLDFCSLRVKKVIGTDLASNLSEDDPEDQWIKWAIAPYIQTSYCTESDYAAGYGKARDKDLFLNQVWSPMKLAGLRPDLRKWVEKKLDERRKRNRPQKGENPSLDNNIMQLSTSQQNEQFSDKKQSLSLNFAASINRFVPNLDAALRSIKDNDGLHQLGPSFVRWPPAFPVLAVP